MCVRCRGSCEAASLTEQVWRIKLDPFDESIITTGRRGGVRAMDAHTGEALWWIPVNQTGRFPHLEFSNGWMIFDRLGYFEVWRSERLVEDLADEARRGAFQRFTILDPPRDVRAFRFQYPSLVCSSLDGYVLEFDVPHKTLVRSIRVGGGVNEDANVNYIEFDDDFVFLVGSGCDAVTVLDRVTGEVVWTLFDHIDQHGAPECYVPDSGQCSAPHGFQQRHLLRTTTPPRWFTAHRSMLRTSLGLYVWFAVHPDPETKTLVVQGQSGLLLIPRYPDFFRNPGAVQARMIFYAFPTARAVPEKGRSARGQGLAKGWQHQLMSRGTHGQLSVAHGRAVSVYGITTLLDLRTPSPLLRDYTRVGTSEPEEHAMAPFTAYEWSDLLCLGDAEAESLDPFLRCSCVQVDHTGIYCVTRQVLCKEHDTDTSAYPPWYQSDCLLHDSSMVTGFQFDRGGKPTERVYEPTAEEVPSEEEQEPEEEGDDSGAVIHGVREANDTTLVLDTAMGPVEMPLNVFLADEEMSEGEQMRSGDEEPPEEEMFDPGSSDDERADDAAHAEEDWESS